MFSKKNKFSFEKSSLNNNVLSKENKLNEWHNKTQSIKFMNSFAQKISCIKIFLKNKFSFKKFSNKMASSQVPYFYDCQHDIK